METSPLNLFQERYADHPWRMLCCVICLNLCSGRAFESVHEGLFLLWPDPLSMSLADPQELADWLSPLGLQHRRARSLRRMSLSYTCLWDGVDPDDLPGIGKYGADSYDIFIRGKRPAAQDKELRKYLEWAKNR